LYTAAAVAVCRLPPALIQCLFCLSMSSSL
jgi:hypothetical protein